MDQTSIHEHRESAGRREALSWLTHQLSWERRLGQLRPAEVHAVDGHAADGHETKQAA